MAVFIHNFPCTTPVLEKSARFQVITLSSALRSLWMRSLLRAYCVHFISRRLHSGMMSRFFSGPFPGPRTLIARGREEMRAYRENGRAHAADRPTRPTRRRRTREGYRGRTQSSVSERSDSHLQRRREHAGYAALLRLCGEARYPRDTIEIGAHVGIHRRGSRRAVGRAVSPLSIILYAFGEARLVLSRHASSSSEVPPRVRRVSHPTSLLLRPPRRERPRRF